MPRWTPTFVTTDDGWVYRDRRTDPETLVFSSSQIFSRIGTRPSINAEIDGQGYFLLRDVQIPRNATIGSAPLTLKYFGKNLDTTNPNFVLAYEPTVNPLRPTNGANQYGRVKAQQTNIGDVSGGTWPEATSAAPIIFDYTSVIQHAVNRPDWVPGNSILLFLYTDNQFSSLNQQISFYSLNSPGNEPTMTVDWVPQALRVVGAATGQTQAVSGAVNSNTRRYQLNLSISNPKQTVSGAAWQPTLVVANSVFQANGAVTNPAAYMQIPIVNEPSQMLGEANIVNNYPQVAGLITGVAQTATGTAEQNNRRQLVRAEVVLRPQDAEGEAAALNHIYRAAGLATNQKQTQSGTARNYFTTTVVDGNVVAPNQIVEATAEMENYLYTVEGLAVGTTQEATGTVEYARGALLQNFRVYRRGKWLVLEIRANKELMLAAGASYFWNYYGAPTGLSLQRLTTGIRYPIAMVEDVAATPQLVNDVFYGYYPAKDLPDGHYQVQGFIKALSGKATVISAAQGFEMVEPDRRQTITFTLLGGKAYDWSDVDLVRQTNGYDVINYTTDLDIISYPRGVGVISYTNRYGVDKV